MIDIETLAQTPDSVILSLGAVKFNPYSMNDPTDGIYFKIDVDEQLKLGRVVQNETLEWWTKQPEDVREEALSEHDRVSLDEVYRQLNKIVVGVDAVWAQGTVFDTAFDMSDTAVFAAVILAEELTPVSVKSRVILSPSLVK